MIKKTISSFTVAIPFSSQILDLRALSGSSFLCHLTSGVGMPLTAQFSCIVELIITLGSVSTLTLSINGGTAKQHDRSGNVMYS